MNVVVNGEARQVRARTVAELLGELGLGDQLVAVERNREIVPRAAHGETELAEGDALEVVHFVGGGRGAGAASDARSAGDERR
ncbi:MAG: sulfur carrier protein ThiS [Myxococcota bacterium]